MIEDKKNIIQVTDSAKVKILEILSKELVKSDLEKKGLRLAVIGGGCSGLTYKMNIDEVKEKDSIIVIQNFKIVIDPKSSVYLKGVVLDFQDGLNGKGFIFENPYAKNKCGCGESFSLV